MDVMDSYKAHGFVPFQLYQIREGLEAGINVSRYADPHFNWYQMEQIKLGLIDGLDVSVYAHPNISSDEIALYNKKSEIIEELKSARNEVENVKHFASSSYLEQREMLGFCSQY